MSKSQVQGVMERTLNPVTTIKLKGKENKKPPKERNNNPDISRKALGERKEAYYKLMKEVDEATKGGGRGTRRRKSRKRKRKTRRKKRRTRRKSRRKRRKKRRKTRR